MVQRRTGDNGRDKLVVCGICGGVGMFKLNGVTPVAMHPHGSMFAIAEGAAVLSGHGVEM